MHFLPLRRWAFTGLITGATLLTGCASVTHGTEQTIRIDTLDVQGHAVGGADCRLSNDKGTASSLSGAMAKVRRSGANLLIECSLPDQLPAVGQAVSRGNAGLAGNAVLGGLIGAAIDVTSGAGFSYPEWIQLNFGEERLYDRRDDRGDHLMAGTYVRAATPDTVTLLALAPGAISAMAATGAGSGAITSPVVVTLPQAVTLQTADGTSTAMLVAATPVSAAAAVEAGASPEAAAASMQLVAVTVVPATATALSAPATPAAAAAPAPSPQAELQPAQSPMRSAVVMAPLLPNRTLPPRRTGQDTYNAEQFARANQCTASPRAELIDEQPGFEVHRVACSNGSALTLVCEYGNCRLQP